MRRTLRHRVAAALAVLTVPALCWATSTTAGQFADGGLTNAALGSGAWVAPVASLSASDPTTAVASWTANSAAVNYPVEYRIANGAWVPAGSPTGTSTSITATPGQKLEFRTQAYNPNESSPWSNIPSVMMPLAAPNITATLTGAPISCGASCWNAGETVNVSWPAVPGASQYRVQIDLNERTTYSMVDTVVTGTSFSYGVGLFSRFTVRVNAISSASVTSSWSATQELNGQIKDSTHNPVGVMDSVARSGNDIRLRGWFHDYPDSSRPIGVHIYWWPNSEPNKSLGNASAGIAVRANALRPDVTAAYPWLGPAVGLDATITTIASPVYVCAYLIDESPAQANQNAGCWTV